MEKIEDWSDKDLSELLKEAQKVYVRGDDEKQKNKTKSMVATVERVVKQQTGNEAGRGKKLARGSLQPNVRRPQGRGQGMTTSQTSPKKCFYCGRVGQFKKECPELHSEVKTFQIIESGVYAQD